MKQRPQRTCLGCRTKKNKEDLIRVIRTKEGQILLDVSGKNSGRGAYLCKSESCLNKAIQKRALGRSLKSEIPETIIEQLREVSDS